MILKKLLTFFVSYIFLKRLLTDFTCECYDIKYFQQVSTQHMLIELYKKFNVDQEEPKCFSCVHKEHNYSIVPHGQECICKELLMEDKSEKAEGKLF